MLTFEEIILPSQKKLFNKLRQEYSSEICVFQSKSYILVKGEAPVMLVAHLDTVHKSPVQTICKSDSGNIWMAPQGIGGDDRCGVYGITKIHRQAQVKPWLLFTCDEEIGGVGASGFSKSILGRNNKIMEHLSQLKYIVELDRKGSNDAVYYDCANQDFEDYITSKGFKTAYGSFSDISVVAPDLGIAAVNLSSGYYNAHTQHEYINVKQLEGVIARVTAMVNESVQESVPQFEYIELQRKYDYWGLNANYRKYYGWDWYNDVYGSKTDKSKVGDWSNVKTDSKTVELTPYSELPELIQDAYNELLFLYTREELDEFRADCGDEAIVDLYEDEVESGALQ